MVEENLGFEYVASRTELTSVAGVDLLVGLMRKLNIPRSIRQRVKIKKINSGFREDQYMASWSISRYGERTWPTLNGWPRIANFYGAPSDITNFPGKGPWRVT